MIPLEEQAAWFYLSLPERETCSTLWVQASPREGRSRGSILSSLAAKLRSNAQLCSPAARVLTYATTASAAALSSIQARESTSAVSKHSCQCPRLVSYDRTCAHLIDLMTMWNFGASNCPNSLMWSLWGLLIGTVQRAIETSLDHFGYQQWATARATSFGQCTTLVLQSASDRRLAHGETREGGWCH